MRGRGEQVLRILALALAVTSLVVVGCGGGGGGNSGTNPPPSTDGSFVKLPANQPGELTINYLTGAGRDVGDITAIIRRAVVRDEFGEVEKSLNPQLSLQLNGYTQQNATIIVPTTSSRFFPNFTFEVQELRVNNGNGFDVFPTGTTQALVSTEFPASIRVLPGRTTSVAVRIDETMFDLSATDESLIFQEQVWRDANLSENDVQGVDTLNGFLSDYVMFDISGISSLDRPQLTGGSPASKVYFSGDFAALSTSGNSGTFEVLTPLGSIEGTFAPVVNLPAPSGVTKLPFGTYLLTQADPRDVDPSDNTFPGSTVHQITALQGTYYNLTDAVGGLSTFEVIAFPRSAERNVADPGDPEVYRELSQLDVVLIKRSGNTITNMYFGQIDFGTDGSDAAGLTLRAYPIGQLDDGDAHNEIEGTLSGLKDTNGTALTLSSNSVTRGAQIQKIGSGTFTLQSGTDPIYGGTLPSDFSSTGRFLVFRR